MATGDGDGLSIGGNHLLHVLRRNVDIKILLFNNRIYGLTKGQYSPTSEVGKITKSTPSGSVDQPIDPASFALGANASFVARSVDVEAQHQGDDIRRAAKHVGTAFTEIYQNCNVFNDGAFDSFTDKPVKADRQIRVEHGKPLVFGAERNKGLRLNSRTLTLEVVDLAAGGVTEADLLVHDETNAVAAYMLARMPYPAFPVALGVLYCEPRPTFGASIAGQRKAAEQKYGAGDVDALLGGGNTWTI
jgi:2-oxoglutarate ferredoxin oxidoreductase subunit beta